MEISSVNKKKIINYMKIVLFKSPRFSGREPEKELFESSSCSTGIFIKPEEIVPVSLFDERSMVRRFFRAEKSSGMLVRNRGGE
jgi:hypothetical protein